MNITQLGLDQFESFVEAVSVVYINDEKKFSAPVTFDGQTQQIVATSLEVETQIERKRSVPKLPEEEYQRWNRIMEKFYNMELNSRTSFSLTFVKKLYYSCVSSPYSDVWSNKFIPGDPAVKSDIPSTTSTNWEAVQKIQAAFSLHFKKANYEKVVVNRICRTQTDILKVPNSVWSISNSAWQSDIPYLQEHILYNPKALIITVGKRYDLSIPEDAKCSVYTMCDEEYEALPAVSNNLIQLLDQQSI